MKCILLLFVLFLFVIPASAQSQNKADDALLLEYYQTQRFAEAADYLKKTYPEPVTDLKILSSLAYASQMAGNLPAAEDYYQRLYATDTTNTAILFSLGSINARRGNDIKAIAYYKKILSRDSSNFNVYKQMGSLSQNTGNITDATYYYRKANKINPVEPDIAYDLTLIYINEKRYLSADTVVSTALQADTTNLLLLLGKAAINYRLNKFTETVEVCNKLVQYGNQSNEVINMLGNSWYNLKRYKNCITTLKLLELSQTASETSYYYMAMSYKALNDQGSAVVYFDKAIKLAISGNVDSYYSEMGDSYDKLHRLNNAVKAYQKSLLYNVKPITYYAMANLYDTELKNKAFALRYYKKFLKSGPSEKQKSYADYAKRRVAELLR